MIWAALGATGIVLPFLPATWSDRFYGLNYLPKWHWYVWALGFLVIAIIAIFEGGHRAWITKVEELESEISNRERPKVSLHATEYKLEDALRSQAFTGEFFVQTEGPQKAFGVVITTGDAAGHNGARLVAGWTPESGTVGIEPVPVGFICSSHADNVPSSLLGPQVAQYMAMKEGKKELIATINFTDIEGRAYKSRWKITKEKDAIGFSKVHCIPMQD